MIYEIRNMEEADWPLVREIYNQALLEGKSTFQTECPDYSDWNRNHLQNCRYVITVHEKVVGWCAISATSSRKVYKGVVEVSIYIDNSYRNKGLGKALLNYLCTESERSGYWCLYASIFSNNFPSINLHKKCGFREIGYRENIAKDRFGQWQNSTLLERRSKKIY